MRYMISLIALVILTTSAAAGEKPAVILKHEGWVAAVAFSPDSKTLASAGADNVVRLWEAGTWKAKGVLKGHTDYVSALAMTGDGRTHSGSFDGTVKFWLADIKYGPYKHPQGKGMILSLAFHPSVGCLVTGHIDGSIHVAVNETGKPFEYALPAHKSWVNSVAFQPRRPEREDSMLASGSSDGTVKLWDSMQTNPRFKTVHIFEGGAGEVRCVAFSPDGKLLAAGNRYHTVRVWDVASKKEVTTLPGHMSDVWSIAFSPDGKTLAAADTDWKKPSKVKLWDTTTWKERGALDVPGEILSIAYSPNGEWLAVGSWDKTVRVFSLK